MEKKKINNRFLSLKITNFFKFSRFFKHHKYNSIQSTIGNVQHVRLLHSVLLISQTSHSLIAYSMAMLSNLLQYQLFIIIILVTKYEKINKLTAPSLRMLQNFDGGKIFHTINKKKIPEETIHYIYTNEMAGGSTFV